MSGGVWRRLRESPTASALAARLPESARSVVAAIARGDALSPVTSRVKRALAPGRDGTVPFGPALRPLAAAVVDTFDAHLHAETTSTTIIDVLVRDGVDVVCSPALGARPRQLVIHEGTAARAGRALQHALKDPAWYVQRLRGGRLVGRPVVVGSTPWRGWLDQDGVRLFRAVAGSQGTLLGSTELGCDLQAWPVLARETPRPDDGLWEPGTAVGPPENGWAPYLPPATWSEAAGHPSHVPAVLRRPGVFDVSAPVDIVFTWVDADDPRWRARRAAAEPHPDVHHPGALDPARFESADELRYALRSVHYYAGWVRRIFIVTAGQVPAWLDTDHARITIIDHSEIFPPGSPAVFNSHAIESRLQHIPGLAEHYLYLNDDVMFGRRAFPEDFYVGDELIRYGVSAVLLDPSPAQVADPPIMAAGKNGRGLIEQRFGRSVRHKVRHTAHPQLRSVLMEMETAFPGEFREVARSTFRSYRDISVAASLQLWYAAASGRAVPGDVDLLFLDVGSESAPRTLDALLRTRQHQVMCLNANRAGPNRDRDVERLQRFLEEYYPVPAPWELGVSSASAAAAGAPVQADAPRREPGGEPR